MKFGSFAERFKKRLSGSGVSLYLHIGMPKTGTTAIQHLLDQNREVLRSAYRMLYPECGVPAFQHAALVKSIVAPKYPWVKFNKAIESFDPVEYVDRIVDQCKKEQCTKVLLSSEFFWAAPAMQSELPYHSATEKNLGYINDFVCQCRELFHVFDKITIIVYVRRQDYWLDSFFGQQIKDGFSIPSQEDLLNKKIYLLYKENIQMWANHFGCNNIVVRVYDDDITDITLDFCRLVGVDHALLKQPRRDAETANTRLSPLASAIMQIAVSKNLGSELMKLLKEVLQETSFAINSQDKRYRACPWEEKFFDQVLSTYYRDNSKLAEMYPIIQKIVSKESDFSYREHVPVIPSTEHRMEQLIGSLIEHVEAGVQSN